MQRTKPRIIHDFPMLRGYSSRTLTGHKTLHHDSTLQEAAHRYGGFGRETVVLDGPNVSSAISPKCVTALAQFPMR